GVLAVPVAFLVVLAVGGVEDRDRRAVRPGDERGQPAAPVGLPRLAEQSVQAHLARPGPGLRATGPLSHGAAPRPPRSGSPPCPSGPCTGPSAGTFRAGPGGRPGGSTSAKSAAGSCCRRAGSRRGCVRRRTRRSTARRGPPGP